MYHAWRVSRRLQKIGKGAEPRPEFSRALATRFGVEAQAPTQRPWLFVAAGACALLLIAFFVRQPEPPQTLTSATESQQDQRGTETVAQAGVDSASGQRMVAADVSISAEERTQWNAMLDEVLGSVFADDELKAIEAETLSDPTDTIIEEEIDTESILS